MVIDIGDNFATLLMLAIIAFIIVWPFTRG
jgi:hypothetical protein